MRGALALAGDAFAQTSIFTPGNPWGQATGQPGPLTPPPLAAQREPAGPPSGPKADPAHGQALRSYELPPPEKPAPVGEVVLLPLPPLEPGDKRFPINLVAALRLSDARPIVVTKAQAASWTAEAELQHAQLLWLPTFNFGADYIRHDGNGPDLNYGENIPQGVNALGQPDPGSFGRPLKQNISAIYAGGGVTYTPDQANYFYQPTPGIPLLPYPQEQFLTDIIFEPLRARQRMDSKRWDIQTAKNNAVLATARAISRSTGFAASMRAPWTR